MHGRSLTKPQLSALRAHLGVPEDVVAIAASARLDLWHGPDAGYYEGTPVTGFESAIDAIQRWASEHLRAPLWLDLQCDLWCDRAPDGDHDGDVDDYTEYDHRAILRELFSGEVAECL